MKLLQTHIHFPDNVLQNIATFLQPIHNQIKIKIEQFSGCLEDTHDITDNCNICSSCYTNPKIYIYLYKNGNKYLFKDFINTLKNITTDGEFPLKASLSHWINLAPQIKPYWTMRHLFKDNAAIIFQKIPVKDHAIYDEKYRMTGTCFALFTTYVREIMHHINYKVKVRSWEPTVHSSSPYYIIENTDTFFKNRLAITNKLFQKYTFPQNQFNN